MFDGTLDVDRMALGKGLSKGAGFWSNCGERAGRPKTNILTLAVKRPVAAWWGQLGLGMTSLCKSGPEAFSAEISEQRRARSGRQPLVLNGMRMRERSIFRHEISDWPSQNSSWAKTLRGPYRAMISIRGTIQKGFGGASGNLVTQLPRIAEGFPEVKNCFHGTLNIELEKPLLVLSPDHRTKRIDWHPDHAPGEVFDLLRIDLEAPLGSPKIPAWLYIAHNSDHRRNLRMHEVIAQKIGASVGCACMIHIDRPCVTLPHRQFPVVVAL